MKIYFNASIAGRKEYLKEFKLITNFLLSLNHKVYSTHVFNREVKEVNAQTRTQHEADYQKARNEIQNSDVMIVEGTYPSIGVGHMITVAIELHKSVLILYQNEPHGLLIGDPSRLLFLKKYSPKNVAELKKTILNFLENSKKRLLNKRFNLMIDETEENYLDWISKKRNVSRADYIRQLIDFDLKKNNDNENFSQ